MNTEQKTDQQIDYGMEELIPVVAVHHRRKNPTKY